jgi:capsular exopolysaccharide synthesis family protein
LLSAGETGKELSGAINDLATHQVTLRGLQGRYTDEHEFVKKEISTINSYETQIIPQYASKLLAQLRASESELGKRVTGTAREIQKIPARTIEEGRRQRAVNVASTVYQDLQSRAVASRLAEQTVMPDIAILDTAVAPRRPTSDTTLSIILIAVVASLGLGIGLALLLDRLDGRFRYPEQAVNELGLDIMGAVPSYTAPRSQRMRLEQASQMVESFRSLALSVRSSFPPGAPVQLTVSSPGPGDGKSTVSINLANALAEGGYRTLLVDGDIRRGQLHESCPPATQAPGLLDYLAGDATLGEVIRSTDLHVNLSLIPCGTRRRQGPELLASQRMGVMLRELRSQFDAIVVDCAPLGAGIDAYALGTATGSMLLVLRAGETDRRLAQSKLTTLDRMPIRILGAVLNDIGESPEFRYYHYLEGYGSPDTVPEVALIGSGADGER